MQLQTHLFHILRQGKSVPNVGSSFQVEIEL